MGNCLAAQIAEEEKENEEQLKYKINIFKSVIWKLEYQFVFEKHQLHGFFVSPIYSIQIGLITSANEIKIFTQTSIYKLEADAKCFENIVKYIMTQNKIKGYKTPLSYAISVNENIR